MGGGYFLQCVFLLIDFEARDFLFLLHLMPLRAKACIWTTEGFPAPV